MPAGRSGGGAGGAPDSPTPLSPSGPQRRRAGAGRQRGPVAPPGRAAGGPRRGASRTRDRARGAPAHLQCPPGPRVPRRLRAGAGGVGAPRRGGPRPPGRRHRRLDAGARRGAGRRSCSAIDRARTGGRRGRSFCVGHAKGEDDSRRLPATGRGPSGSHRPRAICKGCQRTRQGCAAMQSVWVEEVDTPAFTHQGLRSRCAGTSRRGPLVPGASQDQGPPGALTVKSGRTTPLTPGTPPPRTVARSCLPLRWRRAPPRPVLDPLERPRPRSGPSLLAGLIATLCRSPRLALDRALMRASRE